ASARQSCGPALSTPPPMAATASSSRCAGMPTSASRRSTSCRSPATRPHSSTASAGTSRHTSPAFYDPSYPGDPGGPGPPGRGSGPADRDRTGATTYLRRPRRPRPKHPNDTDNRYLLGAARSPRRYASSGAGSALSQLPHPASAYPADRRGARRRQPQFAKSIGIATRRGLGRLTSVKPASAKTWRLPTCSSPQVISLLVGFQNSATGLDLGFCAARSRQVEEAAEDGPVLDLLRREVGGGVAGAGGAGGRGGVVVGCSWPRTRSGSSAGVVRQRSASGRSPRSGW